MKVAFFLTFFIANISWAQSSFRGIFPQGEGMVIEHDHCSILVKQEEVMGNLDSAPHKVFDLSLADILTEKGYRVLNGVFYENDSVERITGDGDLILSIKLPEENGQGHTAKLLVKEKTLKEITVVHSKGYKKSVFKNSRYHHKGKKSLKELYQNLPNCTVKSSGHRVDKKTYNFQVRENELKSCLKNYEYDYRMIKSSIYTGRKRTTLNLVGGGAIAMGLAFPPLYGIGLGVLFVNHVFVNPSERVMKRRLEDGIVVMTGILNCEWAKERNQSCHKISATVYRRLSDSGKKFYQANE